MKLSVIIVNYNVKHYLYQCLESVYRAIKGLDAEVFVVDNHSRDGSISYVSSRFERVNYVESNHNLGFARANNIAIRQSQGEFVLLLNPDTFVSEDSIRETLAFMEEHEDAGAVGVKMLKSDGTKAMESRRGLPTPMTSFYKMTGLCKRFPESRRFGHYYMGYLPWDKPVEIEVVSGAYCMVRRSALDPSSITRGRARRNRRSGMCMCSMKPCSSFSENIMGVRAFGSPCPSRLLSTSRRPWHW